MNRDWPEIILAFGKGRFRDIQSFGLSILSMLLSLIWSLVEIRYSGKSLDMHLRDLEKEKV